MSVNFGAADPRSLIGTGKVGLLTSTGTYDVERYPWAYECWKRQQQTHWMGEEVPLGSDIKDWQSGRLAESEKNLLTQIFRFFTQSDVEVSDNYLKRYIPYLPAPGIADDDGRVHQHGNSPHRRLRLASEDPRNAAVGVRGLSRL